MHFNLSTSEMEKIAANAAQGMSPGEACWAAIKDKEQATLLNNLRNKVGKTLSGAGQAIAGK